MSPVVWCKLCSSFSWCNIIKLISCFRTLRGAFDQALERNDNKDGCISLADCQVALECLGYAKNLIQKENLLEIVVANRGLRKTIDPKTSIDIDVRIDFEEFCLLWSHLSVLKNEISESGCISPIKGTNLRPPLIFLTNVPGENSMSNGLWIDE